MAGFRVLICLLVLLALANLANAATIHGAVYDLSLKKANNVKVEINTMPKQFMVAQNGTYLFNVPNGDYIIKAQQIQRNTVVASVQENITIRQTGSYVLDLILFPDVEEGLEDADIEVNDVIGANSSFLIIAVVIVFSMVLLIYFSFKNRKQKEESIDGSKKEKNPEENDQDKDIQKIISLLKKEGGRATQKEIRKEMPFSEAKISLMIAELEHKGIVEKIKKGRGNIIILKKERDNKTLKMPSQQVKYD